MPTFERRPRFLREFRRLPRELQRAFLRTLPQFVGEERVWELTFAPDGRATFEYGDEVSPGEPHVIWRRIGDHSIFRDP